MRNHFGKPEQSRFQINASEVESIGYPIHVFIRCMHFTIEDRDIDIWDFGDKDGGKGNLPISLPQLWENSKSVKALADWILAIGLGWLVRRYVTRRLKG
jgi:hypothetical protein